MLQESLSIILCKAMSAVLCGDTTKISHYLVVHVMDHYLMIRVYDIISEKT